MEKCVLSFLAFLTLLSSVDSVFEPGCSFMNQQCVYNVKLGHEGNCDVPGQLSNVGTTGSECCTNVQVLQGHVNVMQSALTELTSQMQEVKNSLDQSSTSPHLSANERTQLLNEIAQKEAELNSSQSNLATLMQQSNKIVSDLKESLVNVTQELYSCRGVLGLQTHTVQTTTGSTNFALHLCTFEDGLCGYTTSGSDSGTWVLGHGTKVDTTGPTEDHTLGAPKGTYMLMDTKLGDVRHQSTLTRTYSLVSKEYQPAHEYCIRFWYNMNGPDVRSLKAFIKIAGGLGSPVWQSHGQHGNKWNLAEIRLDSEYTWRPFNFVLQATTDAYQARTYLFQGGSSHLVDMFHNEDGDIAVDDIYVYNTSCTDIPKCPQGWVTFTSNTSSSCYGFHLTGDTWYNSSVACREEGATSHLVSINSKEEQDFLVQSIKSHSDLSSAGKFRGFYTSGNDERMLNIFDWTDTGTPYQGQYTDWKQGQPNNVGGHQHCLLLQYSDLDYQWGDVDCSEIHPSICEVELPIIAA